MEWTSSYHDTCLELTIAEIREKEVRRRVEIAHKVMFKGEAISSGDFCFIPLNVAVTEYNKAVDDLNKAQAEVDRLTAVKEQMERLMSNFQDERNQVVYKRVIERKSLEEIAFEMNRSYPFVAKISSEMRLRHIKSVQDLPRNNVI